MTVTSLVTKTCTPVAAASRSRWMKVAAFRKQAPGWSLQDEARRIERTYRFKNFAEAFTFVRKVAELAEAEGHHPDVSFGRGYATVSLQTKKIQGLHENDFIMATEIDDLAENLSIGPCPLLTTCTIRLEL
ncbi:pterin-4-alpha-carbinolamine dehydratase [Microvirga sp. KLBC 81]|uniref:4a-hydroxytetrahydrobiopterin dehydratase n=1 Tax=Microvirga sp. KLBC 81 TaxID=1862707 RepID=UPI000D523214|nr:4a-hydroxytetrahydrobiopterin dehydratase [Microvirga sp. KLBC 81]PVE20385.1 pterin-4-alpha-carbinolamine dehydratase [Microvirga sp. KLBC 81]